ncbi:MAG: hypothetical protein EOP04_03175 [Proteobacteria bacterium]|nr:MAG: hypothetical protein EOP04_03175 [Pseudomonadota bacterium]
MGIEHEDWILALTGLTKVTVNPVGRMIWDEDEIRLFLAMKEKGTPLPRRTANEAWAFLTEKWKPRLAELRSVK